MRLYLAALLTLIAVSLFGQTRVACVGNSITYGYTLQNRERDAYPFQLQRMLGQDYTVGNFGHSGATLLRQGHRPYNTLPEYDQALEFNPDIVVIHLGINDTDPRDWPHYGNEFVADYLKLIDAFRAKNPNVRVIISLLSPIKATHPRFQSGTRDWRLDIQQAIKDVAAISGAELIDFDTPLRDRQDLLPDGLHPNPEGSEILARTVYGAITGNYGGLSLPPIYTDGMVLQRNRPLTIRGKANAHRPVTVTLDGHAYHTTADNRGDWHVVTAPILTGPTYTLTAISDTDTIHIGNILAGELWIAAGQSNMEFQLQNAVGGCKEAIERADTLLRVYDMRFVALTNAYVWPDSAVYDTDHLHYFTPTRWKTPKFPEDGYFSAVAYHFASTLRDSLNVPVGIISCGVGGSPIESWVDINTLEARLPEILIDYRSNDFLQPWVRQRIADNVTADHRHPYEPSYLFSAAIRPLEQLPVAGAIWYQGESNAHNTEAHEQLFDMFVDSWRTNSANPEMPICFVQLSSMERPSWATFRDSQRRLADSIPGVYMAVSSDKGHRTDVHPRDKKPVGQRLAYQALHNVYGMTDVTPCGPTPVKAVAKGPGTIELTMDNAEGMHSADTFPANAFEIAEYEGHYLPATIEISGNKITLTNMDIQKPRFVRYGWQPYTEANLVNGANLPASTFRLEVENADQYEIESGLECGVSAPYAGMVDGNLIVAGGCNFPTDPMAPNAKKHFYEGIYAANPATMAWQRIGTLPQGMAYGATVDVDGHLIIIGGTSATEALNSVYEMTIEPTGVTLSPLPSLPATIDNMAATAVGRKIYVAGGNVDGKPSRSLYCLDLDAVAPKWSKLRDLPGNPRVQPVMNSLTTPDGRSCLALWGGFAGKDAKHDATLDCSGLLYDITSGKWSTLSAPTDAEGADLSVGGGTACRLTDGKIAVCGGVNKDIFLAALQNQAPDYLQHPIEWYRLNPNILLFDPATMTWSILATTPEAARAGAVAIAGHANDLYLIGGELKPRIRTAETLHINE